MTLIFGTQAYSVEQAAEKLIGRVLGSAPREFCYHRFDAEEMVKTGGAEGMGTSLEAFQVACRSVPFLSENYVVRLDRLESVKAPQRGAQSVQRNLAALQAVQCTWEGRTPWALLEEVESGERIGQARPVESWVESVEAQPGGGALIALKPDTPEWLLARRGTRQAVDMPTFLQAKLKGNLRFVNQEAGAAPALAPAGAPAGAAGRLHGQLEKLVAGPPPDCWLVFTAAAARESDLSGPLLKLIKQHGHIEKFVTYDDYQPVDWVQRTAREKGIPLGRDAAAAFIHLAGNDLGQLAQELEKLSLLATPGSELDEDAVLRAVHGNSRSSLFWITEKLGAKDQDGALAV